MVRKADIEFVEVSEPITEPVTKFGGQPIWIDVPRWPLSRSTGRPMRFICQIRLDPDIFGDIPGKMAYLFMTEEEEDEYVDGTWDSEGGENAVVIQPGGEVNVETVRLEGGPSLYRMAQQPGASLLAPEPIEFAVNLHDGEDPNLIPESEVLELLRTNREQYEANKDNYERYYEAVGGNKVGGTPGFIQGDQFPDGGPWKLLLQLESDDVPFYVNFGDAGVGYAYISEDGRTGKFLWQCF
jgi:uncharacterized protein YwqG